MNKKADSETFSKIGSIILILILVLIIMQFLGVNLWALAKAGLGLTDNFNLINYTQVNDQAKKTFELTLKDIEQCKNLKDKDCVCEIDLSGYYQTHALFFENGNINLVNIKNQKGNIIENIRKDEGVVILKKPLQGLNCFYDKNLYEKKDFEIIYFNDKGAMIFKEAWYTGALTSYRGKGYFISENYEVYKDNSGELCWLTEEIEKSKKNINFRVCS